MDNKSVDPYVGIATASGTASVAIIALSFFLLPVVSDQGMWAIAAMAFAPCVAGIGIACFMSRQKSSIR
jgi:hypothetical protein